jgi:hypothetical protein
LLFAFWRSTEELCLVGAFGNVEAAGDAECLEIGEGWVTELVDDNLYLSVDYHGSEYDG